ncbi:peptidoglycan recognition protein family protein [Fulvivirga aurantia]|uniref:peptidoglycan recognition protein family protein n=1 Tax=Fulvivirga aurantia TaxID=2529383 RepID=UPI001CA3EF2E|nr:peptidoglycan recognition family protein [Fulvivirga aurantia]
MEVITHLAVHHSLTTSGSAKAFANYHVKNNGWPGIGYHYVIEKNGTIIWCNDLDLKTYHVGKGNRYSIGVCMVGDFRSQKLETAQYEALQYVLKRLMAEFSIVNTHVLGHSEYPGYAWKECPCIDMDTVRLSLEKNEVKKAKAYRGIDYNCAKHYIFNPNVILVKPGETVMKVVSGINHLEPGDVRIQDKTLPLEKNVVEPVAIKLVNENEQIPNQVRQLVSRMRLQEYTVFTDDSKPYNLNLVGMRKDRGTVNQFDDKLFVFWKYHSIWSLREYQITTDPGLPYLQDPLNPAGTAVLKEGQYRGAYRIGKHRNKYSALVQAKPVTVYRDNDLDGMIDLSGMREQTGFFGINIHRATASGTSVHVNKWSAGCQVFSKSDQFEDFIKLCKSSASYWGNSFTYTLLSETI